MGEKHEFGATALAYIRERLAWGGTLLNSLLRLPLDQGQVWAYLPSSLKSPSVSRFDIGGILPVDEEIISTVNGVRVQSVRTGTQGQATAKQTIQFIADYLTAAKDHYAIFYHASARRTDPWLTAYQGLATFFTYSAQVYFFAQMAGSEIATNEAIEEAIRCTRSLWLEVAVLTSLPSTMHLSARQEVTADFLQPAAENTEHIIVGAWDAEGELIWSKRMQPIEKLT